MMRSTLRYRGLLLIVAFAPAAWAAEPAKPPSPWPLPGGQGKAAPYRILNLVPDFLAYHDQAKDRNEAGRVYRWNTLLEAKQPAFFSDALYRRKEGAERERFKATLIRQFWTEVAPKIETVRALNAVIETRLRDVVARFREVFPDFRADTDYYITISFSFRGKALTVGGKEVLAIGLEKFDADDPQIPITLAHELFHLYHFQTFSTSGALYRTLWAEGMAVAGSEAVVPGHRTSVYLMFPGPKMNRCAELLPTLARDLRRNLTSTDHTMRRLYLSDDPNAAGLPTESGYYVGYLIVTELAKQQPLARLARLEPTAVLPLLERELTRLAAKP